VDPAYRNQLSPASVQSLALQGGPLSERLVQEFERNPHCRDAVRLRRWDDLAKIPGLDVPGLEHYRARVEAALVDFRRSR
jgi:predicted HD phosphohydrolase